MSRQENQIDKLKFGTFMNTSWTCIQDNDNEGHCFYLFFQEIGTKNYPLGITGIVTALLIPPSNCYAIWYFKAKMKLNKTFLLLLIVLCLYNISYTVAGLFIGLARIVDDHPFGNIGCTVNVFLGTVIGASKMMTNAVACYERRKIVEEINCYKYSQNKNEMWKMTLIVTGILFSSFSIYFVQFILLNVQQLVPVQGWDGRTYQACVVLSYKLGGFFTEIIYTISIFFLPCIIISYNSILIVKAMLVWQKEALKITGFMLAKRIKQRQFRLSIVMACSVVEFLLFQIPITIVLLMVTIEGYGNSYNLSSSTFAICLTLINFECIINPLWISFTHNMF